MINKDVLGWFYLDDAYCGKHETDPTWLEVFYDKDNNNYCYLSVMGCGNTSVDLITKSKEGLLIVLANKKDSLLASYPEIGNKFDDMITKVKKYKP